MIFDRIVDIFAIFEISKNFQKNRFFWQFLNLSFYFSVLDIHFNADIKELESNILKRVLAGGLLLNLAISLTITPLCSNAFEITTCKIH